MKKARSAVEVREVTCWHYVCCGDGMWEYDREVSQPSPRLPVGGRRAWIHWGLEPCDIAMVAFQDKRVVGFFRYYLESLSKHRLGIAAAGTWVHPDFRGQGLALRLWTAAVKSQKAVYRVTATTVSPGGVALVKAFSAKFPHIKVKDQ